MVTGFIGSFVLGFFGTAFPRLIAVRGINGAQLAVLMSLQLLSQFLYFTNHTGAGDIICWILWTFVLGFAFQRFLKREDLPPPGFVLVAFGLFSLWIGLFLRVYSMIFGGISDWSYTWSRILMYENFPICLLLGVAPYFFPKILGGLNRHEFEISNYPLPGWTSGALKALMTAILIGVSSLLKCWNPAAGSILFCLSIAGYVIVEIPLLPSVRTSNGSLPFGLLIGMTGVLSGAVAQCISPVFRIGNFHILIVGGVSLTLMIVSIRVVYGHAGRVTEILGWKALISSLWILLPIAGLTRWSADFFPLVHHTRLVYAAGVFAVAAFIWEWVTLKYWYSTVPENETETVESVQIRPSA